MYRVHLPMYERFNQTLLISNVCSLCARVCAHVFYISNMVENTKKNFLSPHFNCSMRIFTFLIGWLIVCIWMDYMRDTVKETWEYDFRLLPSFFRSSHNFIIKSDYLKTKKQNNNNNVCLLTRIRIDSATFQFLHTSIYIAYVHNQRPLDTHIIYKWEKGNFWMKFRWIMLQ